jgi:primary-amine oxidase
MPAEKMTVSLKPVNFFDLNPSNDVPRSNQKDNKSTLHQNDTSCCSARPSRI